MTARRRAATWLAAAALLHLLSFGMGTVHGTPLANVVFRPGLLHQDVPVLHHFNNFALLGGFSAVSLAVALALGIQALPARWRAGVAGVFLLAWVGEAQLRGPVPLPLAATDVTVRPALLDAIAETGTGGVLLLPRSNPLEELLAVHHGRPMPMLRNPITIPESSEMPTVAFSVRLASGVPDPRIVRAVRDEGVDTIVFVSGLLPPDMRDGTRRRIEAALGPPEWEDEVAAVFSVR